MRRLFPVRHVLVQDNDRVRQCVISPLLQVFAFLFAGFLGIWCVVASYSWHSESVRADMRNGEVRAKLSELEAEKASYRQALKKTNELQGIFVNAACEISEIHKGLSVLAERGLARAGGAADLTPPKLRIDAQDCRAAADVGIAIARSGETSSAEEDVVRGRIDRLAEELKRLRNNQATFLTHAATMTSLRIGHLERVLASVSINIRTVDEVSAPEVSAFQPQFGRGGPFIALRPFPGAASGGTAQIALFNQRATRLADLNTAIRVLPLAEPLADYTVTSSYGQRNDPVNFLLGVHEGVDLGAPEGTPVLATGAGRVISAGYKDRYGYMVEIAHDMGLTTRYAHLSRILVSVGQNVGRGDSVGLVGSTGRSTGSHLHYEVRMNNRPANPMKFINAGRNVLAGR
ncbi:peptidase M23 [Alphaproteobacteria bacterium]|nr:peptidase M23 [Alphaproteobacteria bacterium]